MCDNAKKVMITGASGFLGSHICEAAHEAGYEVHVMVRESSSREWLKHYWLNIHTVGLKECADIASVLKQMDVVIHNAGVTNEIDPEVYYQVNVEGTRVLVEECIKAQVPRFVFISSHAAGGPTDEKRMKTEDDPDCPISHYGKSKKAAEELLFSLRDKIEVVCLRFPTIYGPRGIELLGVFKMLNGLIKPHPGFRQTYVSMLYVKDAARAVMAAASASIPSGSFYYINDGMDFLVTMEYLYKLISDALGNKGILIKVPFFLVDFAAWFMASVLKKQTPLTPDKVKEMKARFWIASSQKAMKELEWRPLVLLREGIELTAEWYRVHQWI
jgi:nucleoside-diphosphate-sugar epimerase